MLYPLKLKPWGGTGLSSYFGKEIPEGRIGESWELCCRDDGMSIVQDGKLQGKTLLELIDTYREKLVGSEVYKKYGRDFPLFFKFIDAKDKLSVQVHPDDESAGRNGLPCGKDELWYVIDAKKNASLIYDLKHGTSKERLSSAIQGHRVLSLLNEVTVEPGDFLQISAGTVHAILEDILIAEIEQNSNMTYRIYDWDRMDENGQRRELQILQALEAVHFRRDAPTSPFPASESKSGDAAVRHGPGIKEFRVDEMKLDGTFYAQSDPESFQVLMNLNGHGTIAYDSGCAELYKGDTVFIPADLGRYRLLGNMLLLHTHIDKLLLSGQKGRMHSESF